MKKLPEFVQIALPIPVRKQFHYAIPEHLRERIRVGHRVRVPFGKKTLTGYCVGFVDEPEVPDVKDIIEVPDDEPLVTEEILELSRWVSEYYWCSYGEALDAAVPAAVRKRFVSPRIPVVTLAIPPGEVDAVVSVLRGRAPKAARALEYLKEMETDNPTVLELASRANVSTDAVKTLLKRGYARMVRKEVHSDLLEDMDIPPTIPHVLNSEQATALEKIQTYLDQGRFGVILIHGVTGSGKTEIYLQAIARAIEKGGSAIVLVPEIALTPQTIARFRSRFEKVAVLHSGLTDSERMREWWKARRNGVRVVIGTRSAVFAPLDRPSLIIVDEEQETSFKQENVPRYNARDVAIVRAKNSNGVVVLGSATPSLESFLNARFGKYDLVRLTRRIDQIPMPPVQVVDLAAEFRHELGVPIVSEQLRSQIEQTLVRGEQVMLFLNRRGFATLILCPRCRNVLKCRRCDVTLTYHKKRNRATCYYCSEELFKLSPCSVCGNEKMRFVGVGTEKIEEHIAQIFPQARVARMDSDTMHGRKSYERLLEKFRNGQIDILVGTQMIAKGLDFPNVTLVGVISADTALGVPDFRGAERTFQLVAQVAGRSGRGARGGRVVVQSFHPRHYAISAAARHDYDTFALHELALRKEFNYAPYVRLVRIIVAGRHRKSVIRKSNEIADFLNKLSEEMKIEVLGPAPAPLAYAAGLQRYHMLVKCPDSRTVRETLASADVVLKSTRALKVIVDVDPVSMM